GLVEGDLAGTGALDRDPHTCGFIDRDRALVPDPEGDPDRVESGTEIGAARGDPDRDGRCRQVRRCAHGGGSLSCRGIRSGSQSSSPSATAAEYASTETRVGVTSAPSVVFRAQSGSFSP